MNTIYTYIHLSRYELLLLLTREQIVLSVAVAEPVYFILEAPARSRVLDVYAVETDEDGTRATTDDW